MMVNILKLKETIEEVTGISGVDGCQAEGTASAKVLGWEFVSTSSSRVRGDGSS